jgi:hypothetical protein
VAEVHPGDVIALTKPHPPGAWGKGCFVAVSTGFLMGAWTITSAVQFLFCRLFTCTFRFINLVTSSRPDRKLLAQSCSILSWKNMKKQLHVWQVH